MTIKDVAEKLLCSATKISRLETGARRPSLRDVRDLCTLYGVNESTSAEFMTLAREAREQGWWTQYEDLKLDPYIGLEQVATSITNYTMYYIPALLQTADYARAIIKAIAPKINPEIHEQRVEVRLRRQQLLDQENRPRYRVLLDEAVLHRPVGGSTVMVAQLERVLEAERRDWLLFTLYRLTSERMQLKTVTSCCLNLTRNLTYLQSSSSKVSKATNILESRHNTLP